MNVSTGQRLTLVAVLAVLVLLPITGAMIARAYQRSALQGFDHRVAAYAQTMAGRLDVDAQGVLRGARSPRELRFDQVFSGWYWQVQQHGAVVATSRSLWDASLEVPVDAARAPQRIVTLNGPRAEALRGVVLRLSLSRLEAPVELIVTLPLSEVTLAVQAFERLLFAALGLLGVMLVLVFALQIHWGLAPLRQLSRELQRVRSGSADELSTRLPADLRQIALTMNEVLSHQRQWIARARSTAGNLAHALKTPLATLRLRIEHNPPDVAGLRDDLAQIQRITDHHLARAAAAGRAGAVYRRTRLRAAVQPIIDAVRAMHRARAVALEVQWDTETEVVIDAQDLQELIGNVLDNAMKWARQRVSLRSVCHAQTVEIQIQDDGPGIAAEARERAMARGMQLDLDVRGSGLGLAIVRDIAALYQLGYTLSPGVHGGLCVTLILPRAL